MANIKSAKKRIRVNAVKYARNKAIRTSLRTVIKRANLALVENAENKAEVVRLAIKSIDQASAKGILHKNTAARKKSQLARKLTTA